MVKYVLSTVGNDIRKAIADGFPQEGAIGSDLHPGWYIALLNVCRMLTPTSSRVLDAWT